MLLPGPSKKNGEVKKKPKPLQHVNDSDSDVIYLSSDDEPQTSCVK